MASNAYYLFGDIHKSTSNPYYHHLYLILSHPKFKSKINCYLELLPHFTNDQIIHMGTLIYALLLPDLSADAHRQLSTQLLHSLQLQSNTTSPTYTHLAEYLLSICSHSIENIDLKSTLALLQLMMYRISQVEIVDVMDPRDVEKVEYNVKLQIYDGQQVIEETTLEQKYFSVELKKVFYSEHLIEKIPNGIPPNKCLLRKLRRNHREIIPFGYFYEQFVHDLINSNFEIKNIYKLKGNKKVVVGKVDYWAQVANVNIVRDRVLNEEIFWNGMVMGGEWVDSQAPGKHTMYRINTAYDRINYLQKAKELTSGQFKYFNILSEFYERIEFNIDELGLTTQKLKDRRKEHFLGIVGKETIKKEERDQKEELRLHHLKVADSITKFISQSRLEASIKSLSITLKQNLEEDHNLPFLLDKTLPKTQKLPRENGDTFMEDTLTLAQINPMQIIIIGRPKCGKTSLSKAISIQYNLVYVSMERVVEKIFERVKFFEENPPELDDDGNPKDGLSAIEKVVMQELNEGKAVADEDLLDLINVEMESQAVSTKGFILDLPLEYNKFWTHAIISNRLYTPKIGCRFFTHAIQIQQTEEQWKHFIQGVMEKPQDLTVTSAYDRYLITKPKPPPQDPDEEAQQEDAEKPIPLNPSTLVEVKWKESASAVVDHLTQHMHPQNFIKVKNAHQSIEECIKLLESSFNRVPLAKKIQGVQKQLLSVGLEESKLTRKWSPWGLVDCVELLKQKVVNGKFQFAAEYGGRVFVFDNEVNLTNFIDSPRKYLQKKPQLPRNTNICIVGPRKSGKKTIANLLASIYQLKVVNLQEIISKVIQKQKSFENHIPSNPDKRSTSVHLSEQEWKDFTKGNLLSAKDVLPIILYELGITLQKKPLGWGVQKTEEEGGQPNNQPVEKAPPKKAKKKQAKNNDDERPKTPPLDDLSLKEIIPEINHFGKLNEIKGYVIIGYPNNEEQLNTLKSFNIPIDKLLILTENNDEGATKVLPQRLNDAELQQVSTFSAGIATVKESLGEQICKDILIDKTPQQMINKIRQLIDPFYLKCDEDSINKVLADKQEDGDPIPMGYCYDYCPVSLYNGWLIKGKEQFEAGIQGKRFKLCGEKELLEFKENLQKYFFSQKKSIPPRIMLMGIRGVGLKTQLLKLNHKHKIPILNLKDSLIQQIDNQKIKRKTERYYKKGFKIPQFNEDGQMIEDPQLNEESADFDKKNNEIQCTKNVFNGIEQILINGNFYDVEEQKVSTGIVELLAEARKLPQVVLMLTCDQKKWLERVLNKKQIEDELENIKKKKKQEKQKERDQARSKAIEAGEEYQQPPQDQEDLQIPKLQQLIAQKQQALKTQREADKAKMEELTQSFKAWNIEVIQIKCERQSKHVTDKIQNVLQPYFEDRINRFQSKSILPIQRHRVPDFINNYIASESRFGKLNPLTLIKPVLPFPIIYKDRIYYLNDEQQREAAIKNPTILQSNQPVPLDSKITPIISVIGKTKTGKTSLATILCKKFGFVLIDMKEIFDLFLKDHIDADTTTVINQVKAGKPLSDEMIVNMIEKRVILADCQNNGWLLDGLPSNNKQCQLLNKKGLNPFCVFSIRMNNLQIKKRVINANKNDYDWNIEVVNQRLNKQSQNLRQVEVYYNNRYNNIFYLNGTLSKWGLFEKSKSQIQKTIKSRRQLTRALCTRSAAAASRIGLSFNCIVSNLSDYGNFCPASYKIRREYIRKCPRHHEYLAVYEKKIYILNSQKQLKDFLSNPQNYINKGISFHPPFRVAINKISQNITKVQNKGYCMVELTRKKLQKGNPSYCLSYGNKFYNVSSAQNLKLFIKNPTLFQMATLQDKLPVQFEKKNQLKKIAKKNDCTAFLEHHLSNILMKSLAQLGYRRPKYPTLGSKQSALKFLAISLKANNPNKDDQYRQKYTQKLKKFIKQCNYSQEIRQQLMRKQKGEWKDYDQQNLLKLCQQFNSFLQQVQQTDKVTYFSQFIR